MVINFSYLRQLKFEHRKVVHYTLLSCIILLQIVAIVTWYNETKLSEAFDNMATANKINRLNSSLVSSQAYFNSYITTKDTTSLKQYANSINEFTSILDSLRLDDGENKATESILKKKQKTQAEILLLKASIDSVIENQNQNNFSKSFKFKELETKKFLDDIKTDSYVKVDSITRKGLFSRLGDAIANRTAVQKEYVNTIVTMQYKDKVTTGNLEEQLANVVSITNNYYANEFKKLKESFSALRKNDIRLMKLNNELLDLSQNLTSDYTNSNQLFHPNVQKQLENQYNTNKKVRSYSIIFLVLLMLVVSVILFSFTRIAFEYEKRLTTAQNQINQNLNFKNRITGMISHEIRSPLSIIGMYSKKARASVKDVELKETFKSIEFTTNSLLLLSNQILEYSKDETHKLSLKNKKVYIKSEMEQIISSMTSLAEAKGNKVEVNSNLESDTVVYADVTKIHQLFYNIIGNANKFTENGLIKIAIQLKPISDFENNIDVTISDNGMGITANDLKNVFESYYQGRVSEKVNDLGVGLGLNICKEIIELFDGEIAIESEQEKGTVVTFNLILTKV